MAQSKHTPGPWVVEDPMGADIGLWIVQDGLATYDWSCIAAVHRDDDDSEGIRRIRPREQEANARLIAAAPDMLAALNAAIECGMVPISSASEPGATRYSRQVQVADQIRAAIAKAEGR